MMACPTSIIKAASDEHTIRLFVGEDTTAPTVPEIITVTPVAQTQIDIAWNASVDDVLVAGYRLFRDSVQIATTTLTSYMDTGLVASTTYTYTVDAFDIFDNFSSTSLPVSTTTLAIIIPPVVATTSLDVSNGGGGIVRSRLETVITTPYERSAKIEWETSAPTQYVIRFGRTASYELGTVRGGVYLRNHGTMLTQLEPGTRYYYELTTIDGRNTIGIISEGSFTTLPAITSDLPANALYFSARPTGSDVLLRWQNPTVGNFSRVRVVRSHLFYPQNPYDGAVVYEGVGESFFDPQALGARSPQYYTIFVLTNEGAVSSGAVAVASRIAGTDSTSAVVSEDATSSAVILPAPADIGDDSLLSAVEIVFEQDSLLQTFEGEIRLAADQPYVIAVPVDSVPAHLKTILVTIQNPTDNSIVSVYMLRLNTAGDRYEAVVAPPRVSGQARIIIEMFDYTAATVRRISNVVYFYPVEEVTVFPDTLIATKQIGFLFLILGLSVMSLWFFLLRRRREDNR